MPPYKAGKLFAHSVSTPLHTVGVEVRRSTRHGTFVHPSAGFDELMPKTLATATVDRLMHHAHICQTAGDSIRLSQALAGKGVMPLNS